MSDMSEFEQCNCSTGEWQGQLCDRCNGKVQAAKQSMQGGADPVVLLKVDKLGACKFTMLDAFNEGKYKLYTHAPDSAARIAELEAENEALRKNAERYQCIKRAILRQPGGAYAFATYMGWIGSTFEKGFDEAIDASINIKGGAE